MAIEIALLLALLVLTLVALVSDRFPPDGVSMTTFAALVLLPVPHDDGPWRPLLSPDAAFTVFGNPAVLTVGALFVVGAALERTGALERVGRLFAERGQRRGLGSMLALLLVPVTLFSAFINSTPVVLLFVPITLKLAKQNDVAPSRLLIPISYAALLGGMCTLIGTSTNVLVHSLARTHGIEGLAMFELAWVGVPIAAVGLAYVLVLRGWLPARESLAMLARSIDSREYLLEVVVHPESRYLTKGVDALPFAGRGDVHILEVIRAGEPWIGRLDELRLRAGDRLLLLGPAGLAEQVRADAGLRFPFGAELPEERRATLFEGVIAPGSRFANQTPRELRFRQRFGVAILAVHRLGRRIRTEIADLRLHFGDTLLLMGSQESVRRLEAERHFLVLDPVESDHFDRRRAPLAIGIAAAIVALAAIEAAPISVLALCGAVALVVTGCLDAQQSYESIRWDLMFLLFGMLALGGAMEQTGAARWLASALVGPANAWGPHAVLGAILLMTILLTSVLTNNAAVVLMVPIALSAVDGLAATLGQPVDPKPFLIAVAIGGSASFATPIGYQTNTYVFGIGGYKFSDFVLFGLPLTVLVWVLATVLIPLVWRF